MKSSASIIAYLRRLARLASEDKISVYAAQASFFVIISAVPFISLMISLVGFFLPANIGSLFAGFSISKELTEIVGSLLQELKEPPTVSLMSFSAITTLWSASKGNNAVRSGLETVYHAESSRNFLIRLLKSVASTVMLMALILLTLGLFLIGDFLRQKLIWLELTDMILRWRTPFLLLFICAFFTVIYAATASRSRRGEIKKHLLSHLPGAVFASVGWTLFSFFYSLYIRYFPNASYIYGSLAAVCLIMLWLYFCMIILLLGAEINKLELERRSAKKK